ncbi:hypothetical protein M404DRAFT_1001740 [Pisolithus tinctorius Marx 270]|uniref:Uncharacterized protein n=1 Tax=Pisolithus tinctorius Marx 270 TaxID=870435 RepID=A0A0C3J216_PISTI|nr:hypothetical protein M404DRAFT_1001740 [Pisolithus tinctorius Marx 270]
MAPQRDMNSRVKGFPNGHPSTAGVPVDPLGLHHGASGNFTEQVSVAPTYWPTSIAPPVSSGLYESFTTQSLAWKRF